MPAIPKTLADVLAVLRWEEVEQQGDPFRMWCSPCFSGRLFVYDRPGRPCLLVLQDARGRTHRGWGSFASALRWLSARAA